MSKSARSASTFECHYIRHSHMHISPLHCIGNVRGAIAWKGTLCAMHTHVRETITREPRYTVPRPTDKKCRLCFLCQLFMRDDRLHARTRAWNTTRTFFVESRTDFDPVTRSLRARNSEAVAKINNTPDICCNNCVQCRFNKIYWNHFNCYVRNKRIISCHVTSAYSYKDNYNGFYCYRYFYCYNYLKRYACAKV